MTNYFKYSLTPFLLFIALNCFSQLSVKPGDKNISYMGRVSVNKDSVSFYWPGSSATINFTGTSVKVSMRSLPEEGFFYAIIDGQASKALKFKSDGTRRTFQLASNLPDAQHSLQLFKISNNTSENIIYGFEIEGKASLLSPAKKPLRKIEFYGNSITAGHGVDVPAGTDDSGLAEYFNNYYTYAAITARHFNAQYSCIARSGIGIMVSWFPEIMPEIYDRLNPMDPHSKWNFSAYTPDIVVINLFQNDYWLTNMPEHPQFKARFGTRKPDEEFIIQSYQRFVSSIREKYPQAHIICALGNMNATEKGSKYPEYIRQAVSRLHDNKIYSLFFPYKNTPGHPKKHEQQAMANDLISFIDKTVKW